jgi:hypothetical protein
VLESNKAESISDTAQSGRIDYILQGLRLPLHPGLCSSASRNWASITASATPSASVPGTRTTVLEASVVEALRRHAEWPQVAEAVIAAAMLTALWLFASHAHTCTKTNHTPCIPSPSMPNLRNMLESCDNRAGSTKRHGNMSPRHAEWPQVAEAVIEAETKAQ